MNRPSPADQHHLDAVGVELTRTSLPTTASHLRLHPPTR
jgi:hypothetical protein